MSNFGWMEEPIAADALGETYTTVNIDSDVDSLSSSFLEEETDHLISPTENTELVEFFKKSHEVEVSRIIKKYENIIEEYIDHINKIEAKEESFIAQQSETVVCFLMTELMTSSNTTNVQNILDNIPDLHTTPIFIKVLQSILKLVNFYNKHICLLKEEIDTLSKTVEGFKVTERESQQAELRRSHEDHLHSVEVDNLLRKNSDMTRQNSIYKNKINELEQQLEFKSHKISNNTTPISTNSSTSNIEFLKVLNENKELHRQIDELKINLEKLQSEKENINSQNQTNIDLYKLEYDKLVKQNDEIVEEVKRNTLKQCQSEMDNLTSRVLFAENLIEKKNNDIQGVYREKELLMEKIDSIKTIHSTEYNDLKYKLQSIQFEKDQLKNENSLLLKENKEITADNNNLQNKIKSITNDRDEILNKLQNMETNHSKSTICLKEEIGSKDFIISRLKEKINIYEGITDIPLNKVLIDEEVISKLKMEISRKENFISELQGEISSYKSTIQDFMDNHKEKENRIAELENLLNEAKKPNAYYLRALEAKNDEISALKSHLCHFHTTSIDNKSINLMSPAKSVNCLMNGRAANLLNDLMRS